MPTSAFFIAFAIITTIDTTSTLSSATEHARRVHTLVQGDEKSRVQTEIKKTLKAPGAVALGLQDDETNVKGVEFLKPDLIERAEVTSKEVKVSLLRAEKSRNKFEVKKLAKNRSAVALRCQEHEAAITKLEYGQPLALETVMITEVMFEHVQWVNVNLTPRVEKRYINVSLATSSEKTTVVLRQQAMEYYPWCCEEEKVRRKKRGRLSNGAIPSVKRFFYVLAGLFVEAVVRMLHSLRQVPPRWVVLACFFMLFKGAEAVTCMSCHDQVPGCAGGQPAHSFRCPS